MTDWKSILRALGSIPWKQKKRTGLVPSGAEEREPRFAYLRPPGCPRRMAKEVANKAPRSCHTRLPGWNEPDPELNHSILVWEPGFGGGFFQLAEAAEFMQERRVVSGRNLCGNCLG